MHFHHSSLRYLILMFSSASVKTRADPKKFSTELALFSSDVFDALRFSAGKHQISQTAMFSDEYFWDFNPGYISKSLKMKERETGRRSKIGIFVEWNFSFAHWLYSFCHWFYRNFRQFQHHVNLKFRSWPSINFVETSVIKLQNFIEY